MSAHHDPIQILTHEHEIIKSVIGSLSKIAQRLEKGERADPDTLRGVVRFLREFADRCHHAKEEDLLFPAMERKGVPESGCPLGGLRHEHEQARALVKAFANAVETYAADGATAGQGIVDAVGKIAKLYADHMWKEDAMVFPMVERLFTEAERDALYKAFEQAEEAIGADHEALAAFARGLQG
jgi:hemerythrin-like domain-containing protein